MGLVEDDGVEDIQLIENLQRTGLNPMDIAHAFLRLARRYDETIDEREFYNRLVLMQRDKNRVTEAFVTTVVTLEKYPVSHCLIYEIWLLCFYFPIHNGTVLAYGQVWRAVIRRRRRRCCAHPFFPVYDQHAARNIGNNCS